MALPRLSSRRALLILAAEVFIACSTCGQGVVNFRNSANTLISANGQLILPSEIYYFALLTAPQGTTNLESFMAWAYATNTTSPGLVRGASTVWGWPPGETRSFLVCGWSRDGGPYFQPQWLSKSESRPAQFGFSMMASGCPGGYNPSTGGTIPTLNLFGAGSIATGFGLSDCRSNVTIMRQPCDQYLLARQTATFTFDVFACPAPSTYQWFRQGLLISGATQSSYVIASVRREDEAWYSAVVSNSVWGRKESSSARLVVMEEPRIWFLPASQTVPEGTNLVLNPMIIGAPPLVFQWFFNGAALPGASAASLQITNAQLENSGDYRVCVTNAYGAVTSAPAHVTVLAEPAVPQHPLEWPIIAQLGSQLTLQASGLPPPPNFCQWYRDGTAIPDATNVNLSLDDVQFSDAGDYTVAIQDASQGTTSRLFRVVVSSVVPSSAGTVVAWGDRRAGDGLGISGLIAAGGGHDLAYSFEQKVLGWGDDTAGQCMRQDLEAPLGLAAGEAHSLAVTCEGTVVAWGANDYRQCDVPGGLSNIVKVAAAGWHSLALTAFGTVLAWGDDRTGQSTVPGGLYKVVAIAAGPHHSLAVRRDGTVVGWGDNSSGQISVPADLTNAVMTAAGGDHSLALKANGMVVAWGGNLYGQSTVPAGLRNVVAVAAGGDPLSPARSHSVALKADGSVVAWGDNSKGQTSVPLLKGVSAVAAAKYHTLAIVNEPAADIFPTSQTAVLGSSVMLSAWSFGAAPLSFRWLLNDEFLGDASPGPALQLTNLILASAGRYNVFVSNAAGCYTSAPAFLGVISPLPTKDRPGLRVHSQPGAVARLEFVADTSALWQTLETVTLTNESRWFFDPSGFGEAQRFYRVSQDSAGPLPSLDLYPVPSLTVTGALGSTVCLEYIERFGKTNAWRPLGNLTLTNSALFFSDPTALGSAPRLYRSRLLQ